MIKYLKKLLKKLFGQTSKALPENIGEEVVKPIPKPKPLHCDGHIVDLKKVAPTCREVTKIMAGGFTSYSYATLNTTAILNLLLKYRFECA